MNTAAGVRVEFDFLTRHRSFAEMAELARRAYRGRPRPSHTDEALWRAFPRGYVGAWIDGELRGSIQIWPLDGRRAGDFLQGARREEDLTDDDFATVCNSPRVVWYFSGLLVDPDWRDVGLGAHLLAESMVRWQRELPWRMPVRFAALAASEEGRPFINAFGMTRVRPADETADRQDLYALTFATDAEMAAVVGAARAVADRKGRLVNELDGTP